MAYPYARRGTTKPALTNFPVPENLSTSILTKFHLSPREIQSCDRYYILYWQARFFYIQLLKSPRILREGVIFTPVFMDDLTELELQSNPTIQIKLSFRKIRTHSTGYVLIGRAGTPTSTTTPGESSS
jgi:hypothetical protein